MSLFKGNKKIAGLYVDHEIEHATEAHAGIIEIADSTEVEQGIIDSKAVTPKKLKTELDKKQNTISDLSTIRSNANNSVQYNTVTSKGLYLSTHPELSTDSCIIPFIHNDIAFLAKKGGSCTITRDGMPLSASIANMFNGSPNYLTLDSSVGTEWVIDITLPPRTNNYTYGNIVYIDFGHPLWVTKYIKIEYKRKDTDTYVQAKLVQNNSNSAVYVSVSGSNIGLDALRFTLREPTTISTSGFRIAQIGVINYQSNGAQSTLLGLDGGTLYGDVNFASGKLVDYVKNTDYAESTKGGVVKVGSSQATFMDNNGALKAQNKTLTDYTNLSTNAFIGKGTLENIKEDLVTSVGDGKYQPTIFDLEQIRENAKTGADLAPQVAVNTQRIEDLTTAKFPNAVIIGTPHIEGGQVSNYSDTSYLQFPFVDISRGQPFDIYFSFTTSNDVTTQQNILDSYFGIALAIQNSKGIMALSSNGQSWDIGTSTGTNTLLPNTTYYVKYSWTGAAYSAALSTNDETYVPDMNLTSSLSPHKTTIFIGGSPNLFGAGTAHPFKGTINFNKSKVVVNGITVWEGMADVGLASRANVSLNNLDEVGEKRFTDLEAEINNEYQIRMEADSQLAEDLSNKVSKTGDSMTGNLTIERTGATLYTTSTNNSYAGVIAKSTQLHGASTTTPATNLYGGRFYFQDADNVGTGWIQNYHSTSNRIETSIGARRKIGDTTYTNSFNFGVDANGKVWFQRPQIITSYVSGTSGYNIWSNGYCEQWGALSTSSTANSDTTVSFAKTFKDTNYNLLMSRNSGASTTAVVNFWVRSRATNSFKVFTTATTGIQWRAFGYLADNQY